MVLGQVISKLSEGHTGHVPFRDSNLTRILKKSLGGNTKTAIICTVTPAEDVQTKSTLDFAARAKKIVQHATVNEIALDEKARDAQLKKYREQITNYEKEIELIRNNNEKNGELEKLNSELNEKVADLQAKEKMNMELLQKLQELQNQFNQRKFDVATEAFGHKQMVKKSNDRRMTLGTLLILRSRLQNRFYCVPFTIVIPLLLQRSHFYCCAPSFSSALPFIIVIPILQKRSRFYKSAPAFALTLPLFLLRSRFYY